MIKNARKTGLFGLAATTVAAGLLLWGCDSVSVPNLDESIDIFIGRQSGAIIPGQYIVVLDKSRIGKAPEKVVRDLMREEDLQLLHAYGSALPGFAATMTSEQAQRLKADERISYIEPDRVIRLAPLWCSNPANAGHPACSGGDEGSGGQETPWGVTRVGGAVDGRGMIACVIDSGVDLDHPDLNVDTGRSREFVTKGKGNDTVEDGDGHGTHVSGIIAAIDNGSDVVGVAAGATIIAVKVLNDRGSGTYSDVIAGVDYAKTAGCMVANMSLGGPASNALDDAVKGAASDNLKFVVAAGNESHDTQNYSPARIDDPDVYVVSAIDSEDVFASFSNYGANVDYAAPGVGVKSLYKDGGTQVLGGTSMAAPHVAGLLLTGGVTQNGAASEDPDGNPDPIGHR